MLGLDVVCDSFHSLQPCGSFDRHFDNLIKPLIWGNVQFVLVRHILRQEPSTHKVSALEPLDQWLWRRQTDQGIRVVSFSWALVRRASLNVPATGCIDSQNRNFRGLKGVNDGRERFANFAGEREAEDGVDYVVGG